MATNIANIPPSSGGGGAATLPSTLILADATTATAPDLLVLRHTTSGTPAAGFGETSAVELANGAGTTKRVMTDVTTLTTVTDAAEISLRTISAIAGGAVVPVAGFGTHNGGGGQRAMLFLGDPANNTGLNEVSIGRLDVMVGGASYWTCTGSVVSTQQRVSITGRLQQGQGATVASATTVTLGADGNVFPISGTTTINGIVTTTWTAGAVIYLKFAGILTLTNNSGAPGGGAVALKTTTGANVNTTANSIATFMYDGTFWCQLCPITPGY